MLSKRLDKVILAELIVVVLLFVFSANITTDFVPLAEQSAANDTGEKVAEDISSTNKNLEEIQFEIDDETSKEEEVIIEETPKSIAPTLKITTMVTPTVEPTEVEPITAVCIDTSVNELIENAQVILSTKEEVIEYISVQFSINTQVTVEKTNVLYNDEEMEIWHAKWKKDGKEKELYLTDTAQEVTLSTCEVK